MSCILVSNNPPVKFVNGHVQSERSFEDFVLTLYLNQNGRQASWYCPGNSLGPFGRPIGDHELKSMIQGVMHESVQASPVMAHVDENYIGFVEACKHIIGPIFRSQGEEPISVEELKAMWRQYQSVHYNLATKVFVESMGHDFEWPIWVHGANMLGCIGQLRLLNPSQPWLNIRLTMAEPWPQIDRFKTSPFYDEIMKNTLKADVICFARQSDFSKFTVAVADFAGPSAYTTEEDVANIIWEGRKIQARYQPLKLSQESFLAYREKGVVDDITVSWMQKWAERLLKIHAE